MNDKKHKLSIIGATGRMGQMLIRASQERPQFQLVGLLEAKGHSLVGTKGSDLFSGIKENLTICVQIHFCS